MLETLRGRRERLEEMERDRDALFDGYTRMAPKALDSLIPEERCQVYRMLGLAAVVRMDGALEVGGMFGQGGALCQPETQYSTP